jgi:hypothetical protein
MARILALRDLASGYVYFRSGDRFHIPEDARLTIKRSGGDFSGETHDWRVGVHRAPDVVAAMRVAGHSVITDDIGSDSQKRARECQNCGAGVRHDFVQDGSHCKRCKQVLVPVTVASL